MWGGRGGRAGRGQRAIEALSRPFSPRLDPLLPLASRAQDRRLPRHPEVRTGPAGAGRAREPRGLPHRPSSAPRPLGQGSERARDVPSRRAHTRGPGPPPPDLLGPGAGERAAAPGVAKEGAAAVDSGCGARRARPRPMKRLAPSSRPARLERSRGGLRARTLLVGDPPAAVNGRTSSRRGPQGPGVVPTNVQNSRR